MKNLILSVLLFFIHFFSYSQSNELIFDRIGVEDGLSQSWVMSIEQDDYGFMWFGTSGGLNKYDGYNFEIFSHDPRIGSSILNNYISSLEKDQYGRLWVGTRTGLCLYNHETNDFIRQEDWPVDVVDCMFSYDDQLYLGTYFGFFVYNLINLNPEADLNRKIAVKLANIRVNCMAFDDDQTIWLGTDQGLYFFDMVKKDIGLVECRDNFYRNKIKTIEVDNFKRVWVGTIGNGLFLINKKNSAEYSFKHFFYKKDDPEGIRNGNILALQIDQKNYLWIGVENSGLDRLYLNEMNENPAFEHFQSDAGNMNTLSSNSIHSFFLDREKNMWLGTYGGGINLNNIDRQNFTTYRHISMDTRSLANNMINEIYVRGDNAYIGTEGGLSVLNLRTKKIKNFSHSSENMNTITSNAVWSVFPKSEEEVWLGAWAGGICILNSKTGDVKRLPGLLPAENVFSILRDSDDDLWCGTMGSGMSLFRKNDLVKTFRAANDSVGSILTDWILYLYQNRSGEIWIATMIGVDIYNKKKQEFTHFSANRNDSVSLSGIANYIFEDSRGTMWFATDAGLNYFVRKDSSFRFYTVNDGLPNSFIKSILEDNNGNLWMGSNNGLVVMKRGIDLPKKPDFITYNVYDGLQGNEFNRKSAFRDSLGYMYFGGINGLNIFHPDSMKLNELPPVVVLTNLFVMNKPVKNYGKKSPLKKHISLTREIILNHNQSTVGFEFAALNFYASHKNQYMYKLDGFEREWNHAGNQRMATYTNLDPGEYTFLVKASNNDLVWNENPLQLNITVMPPWWGSNLAKVAYVLFFILGILAFLRLWQNRFKKQEQVKLEMKKRQQEENLHQQRVQFFMNISHEFRTPLSLIFSPIEEIMHNPSQIPVFLKRKLTTVYKNTLRLNRLIEELMVFRKLEHNKLELEISMQDICAFLTDILTYFEEEAEMNQIRIQTDLPKNSVFLYFDAKMLEKVFFNLISNAFKVTAEGGTIGISVNDSPQTGANGSDDQWVSISVSDSGPGLTQEQTEKVFELFYHIDNMSKSYYSSAGIGLTLARNLVEKHNGEIRVTSEPGRGSVFTVLLRKGKNHFSSEIVNFRKADFPSRSVLLTDENKSPDEPDISEGRYSILIIEDNVQLRHYLRDELKKQFKIFLASDGMKGAEIAQKYMPDVIVCDIIMPVKNGLELCAELKNSLATSHIPIILLTAKGGIEDQIQGNIAGADAYLIKPFHSRLLKTKISQLIRSREDLFKKYSGQIESVSESKSYNTLDKNFLEGLKEYIIMNISDSRLSVKNLSVHMNLSRSQLYRKVKSLTGISVNEFIRITRLEQAKKQISSRKFKINEIGYNVGFTSPSYFSKCYREYYGKLPSEEEV